METHSARRFHCILCSNPRTIWQSFDERYDTFHFLIFLDVVDILKKNPITFRLDTNKVPDQFLRLVYLIYSLQNDDISVISRKIYMKNISIFKFSSIIYYDESLLMKSFQIFKIHQHFDKEREKETHTAVNENRKIGKICTLFYNRYFYKAL